MHKTHLFLILILLTIFSYFLSSYLLISDNLYYNTFAEQLTFEQIELIISENQKWNWVSYIILPFFIFLKLILVASCLSIGLYFFTNHFLFKSAFGVALVAEFVFLIPILLKITWFAIFQTNYTLQELQLFYPFSALNFFDSNQVQPWLIYPLQLLNIFEIIYWVLLARGVSQIIEKDISKSFEAVMVSYGAGLMLWVAIVMFITVSFSP